MFLTSLSFPLILCRNKTHWWINAAFVDFIETSSDSREGGILTNRQVSTVSWHIVTEWHPRDRNSNWLLDFCISAFFLQWVEVDNGKPGRFGNSYQSEISVFLALLFLVSGWNRQQKIVGGRNNTAFLYFDRFSRFLGWASNTYLFHYQTFKFLDTSHTLPHNHNYSQQICSIS